jgi:hypothetical protein
MVLTQSQMECVPNNYTAHRIEKYPLLRRTTFILCGKATEGKLFYTPILRNGSTGISNCFCDFSTLSQRV